MRYILRETHRLRSNQLMAIVDEKHFLTHEEHEHYTQLLKLHSYKPHHLLVEIKEDQSPMDMNDMDYVIILKVKVTNVDNGVSNTYLSKLGSQTWLSELESDLNHHYYSRQYSES